MIKRLDSLITVLLVLLSTSSAWALSATVYINKGSVFTYGRDVHACSFNDQNGVLELANTNFYLDENEPFDIKVVNTDSMVHGFVIAGIINQSIPANDSVSLNLSFPLAGTYRYYSDQTYGFLAGASGVILVGNSNHPRFIWNLFEVSSPITSGIVSDSIQSIPSGSNPDLFFINGRYFPNTVQDPDAFVSISQNDTAIIGIVNSGNMDHVLHFHGFHVEILQASIGGHMIGWSKDTFPVKIGERIMVRLIADQVGNYPVHDHNLIAVTNAGLYPGGMLTRISVSP